MEHPTPRSVRDLDTREFKERIEAERRGAFLVDSDAGTQLLVELGAGQDRFTIGRRGDVDIALDWDGEVWRLHAQPERVGQQGMLVGDGLSRTARS
jgi:hypothetical protein